MSDKPPNPSKSHDWSQFLIQKHPGGRGHRGSPGPDHRVQPAAERLSGYSREEAMGHLAEEILQLQGADPNIWNQVLIGQKRAPRNSPCATVQARRCR